MSFQNRTFFDSDTLQFLQGIDPNTIDLIVTDPPFNRGKDFLAIPESALAGAFFQADSHDYKIGATRMICNPRGYPNGQGRI